MTYSMTAFARQHAEFDWGTLVWEIRSVNHRYLEPSFKLPETLRHLEPKLREQLRKSIHRGKVDLQLRFTWNPSARQDLSLNETLLDQLIHTEAEVRRRLDRPVTPAEPLHLNTLDLLRWPGVIQEQEEHTKAIEQETLTLFGQTLEIFRDQRAREGKALAATLHQRLDSIERIVGEIHDKMPEILEKQQQRLRDNLTRVVDEGNPERLEQEIVMLVQKADIDEEVDRLTTHVAEVRRILTAPASEPIGRRLDFLMQELNREANTLSSKAIVADTTFAAVELKVLIEQMREQIQNIE